MSFAGVWKKPSQSTDRFQSLKKLVRPPNPETVKLFCPADPIATLSNLLGRKPQVRRDLSEDGPWHTGMTEKNVRIGTSTGKRKAKGYQSIDLGRKQLNLSISNKMLNKQEVPKLEYHVPMTSIKSQGRVTDNLFQSFDEGDPRTEVKVSMNSGTKVKPFRVSRQSFLDEDLQTEQSWIMKKIEKFNRTKDTLSYKYQFVTSNLSLESAQDDSKQGQMWDIYFEKINQVAASMLELIKKSVVVDTSEMIQLCDKLLSKASHCIG